MLHDADTAAPDTRLATGPRRLVLLLWLLGLALSALAGWRAHMHNEAAREARLQALVEERVRVIEARFLRYESGLRGTLGAVLAAGGEAVTRRRFESYISAHDLAREFPGARGFGFVRRVPRALEQDFLGRARAEGPADFRIRGFAPHDGERLVLQYLYPRQGNEAAWGLDIAGDANRRATALAAMHAGQPRLSAPVTLVQDRQRVQGAVVMLLPVFRHETDPGTPAAREADTLGWTMAPIVVSEVLQDPSLTQGELAYTLSDAQDAPNFYSSPDYAPAPEQGGPPRAYRQLTVYGRTWVLEAHALPGLHPADELPAGGDLAAGLALLCTLLAFTADQAARARRRRLELLRETERFTADIVDATPQALLVVDDGGRIVRANRAAAELFGYALEQLVGLPVDALVGAAQQHEHAQLRAGYDRKVRGIGSRPGLSARRRDGSEFKVALRLSPLQAHGQRFVVASLADITAQQEALAALERSEQRWREMANLLPHLVWSLDADGTPSFFSQRWLEFTGLASEAELGARLGEIVHPEDRAAVAQALRQAIASRGKYQVEYRLRRHDGVYRWFLAEALPLLDARGEVLRWIGAHTDIDDRRRAEGDLRQLLQHLEERVAERTRELEKARRDLNSIVNALPSVICYWDRHTVNRFANQAYRSWFDIDPGTVPGRRFAEVFGAREFESLRPYIEGALQGRPQVFEQTYPGVGGRGGRHGLVHYIPDASDGEVRGFYSLLHDITELTESRRALDTERRRLHDILCDTNVGTWEWNVQSGEARFNERWADIVGCTLQELQPVSIETWHGLIHPQDLERSRQLLERHFRGETEHYECEARMRHRDGHWVWVLDTGRVTSRGADGQPQWMHGIHQDITERHAAATALQLAKQAAEAANAAKSEFLANMSHEIRTPLNAVIGLAYLLEQSALDPAQQDSVARIQVASRTLLGVINDVLDLAKIEARQMDLESRPFDLRALLQDLRDLFTPQAQRKGLVLAVDEAPDAPDLLVGDDMRLRQILVNLLANALKFTERGEVALRVRADAPHEGRVRLHFEVRDTGIGIAPAALQRLFSPFAQADAGTTRHYGGTGLGLSIVRRLAELMGGQATVRSEPGRGSRFQVSVELGLALRPDEAGGALQVLVAGDDGARTDTLASLCRALGWRAETLPLHQAAARLQPGLGQDRAPDLLLLLDAGAPAAAPDCPATLLAGALSRHDVHGRPAVLRVRGDGAAPPGGWDAAPRPHGLLHWPASTSSLFSAVTQVLARQSGGLDRLTPGQAPPPDGYRALLGVRVLVVDDSDINRDVARRILELQGAVVGTAANGRDALERLRADPGACDLVLMDVQMPVMDGLEATRRLRGELALTRLPVLALTAGALVSERERARAAGMDDFITKPLDPMALVRAVRWHVEQAQGKPLPGAAPTAKPSSPVAPGPRIEGVDVAAAAAAARMGCDPALFESLLERLLQEYSDLEDEATVQLQLAADPQAFAARLHRLRGSAAMLGVESLDVVAQAFEDGLNEGMLDEVDRQQLGAELSAGIRELRSASPLPAEAPASERSNCSAEHQSSWAG